MRSRQTLLLVARCLLGAAVLLPFSFPCADAQPTSTISYANKTITQLIDELTLIDSQSPAIDSAAMYGGFVADDAPNSFEGGVLGVAAPPIPPQLRELVRRGPAALPELLQHLDDSRPTKLKVGNLDADGSPSQIGVNTFMFTYFSAEYVPRRHNHPNVKALRKMRSSAQRDFSGSYTVKVGDVCFVLIGQIVNRRFLAVRYQPSAGLVVNSPIEFPDLAKAVRNDWDGADANAVRASLLTDLKSKREAIDSPALRRMKFYFPDTYDALKDNDARKRAAFEENQRTQLSQREP